MTSNKQRDLEDYPVGTELAIELRGGAIHYGGVNDVYFEGRQTSLEYLQEFHLAEIVIRIRGVVSTTRCNDETVTCLKTHDGNIMMWVYLKGRGAVVTEVVPPPKPEEPTGLWPIIEAALPGQEPEFWRGEQSGLPAAPMFWVNVNDNDNCYYKEFEWVRIVRDGV